MIKATLFESFRDLFNDNNKIKECEPRFNTMGGGGSLHDHMVATGHVTSASCLTGSRHMSQTLLKLSALRISLREQTTFMALVCAAVKVISSLSNTAAASCSVTTNTFVQI